MELQLKKSTKENRSETSRKKPNIINDKVPKPKLSIDEDTRKHYCQSCGKSFVKQQTNFPTTQSPMFAGNNGFTTMCKSCTIKWNNYYIDVFSGNEEKAIDKMSALFDWYYSDRIFASTRKISADRERILAYPAKMNLPQYHPRKDKTPLTYLDTIKDRDDIFIDSFEDAKEKDVRVTQKTLKFFGLGFEESEYKILSDQYDDWTARNECKTKAQEELFKNLCIAQLNIQKATQGKIQMKVDAAMAAFQNLLDSANLKPKQTNDNTLSEQNTVGMLIKKWENERPIPEPLPEWKDVDNITKYITVYFLGHLCKMMGIKNSYSRAYDLEMNKYKVEKPEYEDDDDALFDSVFGGELVGDK